MIAEIQSAGCVDTPTRHRPEPQRLGAAARDLLDRQAGLEPHRAFEVLELDLLAAHELADERVVLRALERRVPVIPLALVVARLVKERLAAK